MCIGDIRMLHFRNEEIHELPENEKKEQPFSTKTNNILHLFTFPHYTIMETPDFCVIVYFCLIVQFSPQSPCYQRH